MKGLVEIDVYATLHKETYGVWLTVKLENGSMEMCILVVVYTMLHSMVKTTQYSVLVNHAVFKICMKPAECKLQEKL